MKEARYQANCLPGPRETFKQDSVDLTVDGAGGIFNK